MSPEYAAAFFLLADHLADAIQVLHNQLQDTQLAIAVARVYEGDDGPILRTFLKEKILPQAARDGNRWLATWAFWMIGRRDNAVRSIVTPLSTLLSPPETPNFKSKWYFTDDPALVVLYKQLREKSLQTLRGATMIGMREEWEFVLHTAGLYERMGCDLLALDLGMCILHSHAYQVSIIDVNAHSVKTWEFLTPPPQNLRLSRPPHSPAIPRDSYHAQGISTSATDLSFDPRKLLRRRSSLVIADLPSREHVANLLTAAAEVDNEESGEDEGPTVDVAKEKYKEPERKPEEKKKPPPTQFTEPDAGSFLDAFGF